jgi:RsiW-degrading membrane proteinase PrsW (M82 family)
MPAFWLFVVAIVLGFLYSLLVTIAEILVAPAGFFLSVVLMLLYIVPVALVLRWLDQFEREPRSLVIGAFLWGLLVAPLFAGLGNDTYGVIITKVFGGEFAWDWSAAMTAPVIEEIYKYLGIVLLYLIARAEFDDLLDGFVYGALIGLGFAVTEDIFYFIFTFGGDIPSVLEGFYVRVIASGLYGHVTFTGIAGIGFAYFVTRRGEQPFIRRLLVAAALLLLAMAAHFVWNSPFLATLPILLYGVVKGLPFFIGMIILVVLARRREHQTLGALLTPEIGRAGLTQAEVDLLGNRHARREISKLAQRTGGGDAKRALRRLQREDVNLALVESTVDSADDARLIQQRETTRSIRAMLVGLPGVAAALRMTPADMANAQASLQTPFRADHLVGSGGAWAWTVPDQSGRRMPLARNLPLQTVESRGEWLLVRSAGGWYGWTGVPYLVPAGAQAQVGPFAGT